MPERIEPAEYEPHLQVRKVDTNGRMTFKGRTIRCPKAFIGKRVALRVTQTDGLFDLCYRHHVLTQVDLRQNINLFTMSPNT